MRFLSGFLKIANFSQLGTWEDKGFCFHSSALHQDSDVAKRHPSAIDPPTVVRQSSTFLTNIFVTFARHGDSERYYMGTNNVSNQSAGMYVACWYFVRISFDVPRPQEIDLCG